MTNATTNGRTMDATRSRIGEMLRENTGCHFLDSGDAYGRHWQQNAERTDDSFDAEPSATLSLRYGEIDVTVSAFHFLAQHLHFDADDAMRTLFRIYCDARENVWGSGVDDGFLGWIREIADCPDSGSVSGIYGEGYPVVHNTYNGEDLVSQTLLYTYATIDVTISLADVAMLVAESETDSIARDLWKRLRADNDDGEVYINGTYIFLSVHGGADVRGGYTDAEVFTESGCSELGIFDNARASIGCTDCDESWYTDDACNWYPSDSVGPNLNEYKKCTLPDRCDTQDSISNWEMAIARAGFDADDVPDIDESGIGDKAYRLSCDVGFSGAIERLTGQTDAESRLMLYSLTGCERTAFGVDPDSADTLFHTESGKAFCPCCGHKLDAGMF